MSNYHLKRHATLSRDITVVVYSLETRNPLCITCRRLSMIWTPPQPMSLQQHPKSKTDETLSPFTNQICSKLLVALWSMYATLVTKLVKR